jgi:hypothetical protein
VDPLAYRVERNAVGLLLALVPSGANPKSGHPCEIMSTVAPMLASTAGSRYVFPVTIRLLK